MISQPGYYSLVQYCPDKTRMEAANVGVLLFCPGWNFLGVRHASQFGRIRQFFRRDDFDVDRLQSTLKSLEKRLEISKKDFRDKDDLIRFIDTRANEIVLTQPRAIKVLEPQADLDALYREVLGRKEKEKREKKPAIPELDRIFRRPSIEPRAKFNLEIPIPLLGDTVHVPYAFQNGVQNLVRPERFSARQGLAKNRSEQLALEGDLIQRNPGGDGIERKIVIVAKLPGEGFDDVFPSRLRSLFGEYKIRLVMMEQIEAFANEIEQTIH